MIFYKLLSLEFQFETCATIYLPVQNIFFFYLSKFRNSYNDANLNSFPLYVNDENLFCLQFWERALSPMCRPGSSNVSWKMSGADDGWRSRISISILSLSFLWRQIQKSHKNFKSFLLDMHITGYAFCPNFLEVISVNAMINSSWNDFKR